MFLSKLCFLLCLTYVPSYVHADNTSHTVTFTDSRLVKVPLEEPISLDYREMLDLCSADLDSVVFIFERSELTTFQMMTSFRFGQNFEVQLFDEHTYDDDTGRLQLSRISPNDEIFDIRLMPGPTVHLHMINDIISPYADTFTYIKAKEKATKNLALVYHCQPETDIPQSLISKYSQAYFAEIPNEEHSVSKQEIEAVRTSKFISAGFFEGETYESRVRSDLASGFVYKVRVQSEYYPKSLFYPLVSVEYEGCDDKPRYPEKRCDSSFRVDIPPVGQKTPLLLTVYHLPNENVKVSFETWWSASIASICRRNLELFISMLVVFIVASSRRYTVPASLALLARGILSFQSSALELFVLVVVSFSIADTLLTLTSLIISHPKLRFERSSFTMSNVLKISTAITLAPCLIFKLSGIIAFVLAMQLVFIRTVFASPHSYRIKASSLILEIIAIFSYISVRIPDILAAVQYHVPLPFEFETHVFWLWGLIVWNQLSQRQIKASERHLQVRILLQLSLIIWRLPTLTLADLWPAFCIFLSVNFLSSLLPL